MSDEVTYEGCEQFVGWTVTLIPMTAGEFGEPCYSLDCPGYKRVHLTPSKHDVYMLQQAERDGRATEAKRAWVHNRPPDWVEAGWLVEWLKHGLLKRVK
jgi:hypothetical protein